MKRERGLRDDTDLTGDDMITLAAIYKDIVMDEMNTLFPQDPWDQLWGGDWPYSAVGQTQGRHLSTAEQYSGRLGDRGKYTSHGVWQYGR